MEGMYKKTHAAIRDDPAAKKAPPKKEGKVKRYVYDIYTLICILVGHMYDIYTLRCVLVGHMYDIYTLRCVLVGHMYDIYTRV